MNLILVRHGETDWNSVRRYQGQLNVPLNTKGMWQARQVGDALAGRPIQHLVCSDLQRARDTAAPAAVHCGLTPVTDPRLRELDFGSWQGLTYTEILKNQGDRYQLWKQDPVAHPPPQGEAMDDAVRRITLAFQDITALNAETVLLVAHGGSLRVLLRHLLHLPQEAFWQIELDNGSLSEVRITPDGAELVTLNDTRHLHMADASTSPPVQPGAT